MTSNSTPRSSTTTVATTTTTTTTTATTTTTTTRATKPSTKSHPDAAHAQLHLSANFAHNPKSKSTIGYDHEVYLQLMAGRDETVEKTPNQIYREERARRRTTRALDPAISDPQGDPSPVDFECAESQGLKDRVRG